MEHSVQIGERLIGPSHTPYVVAELSGNHNGSMERARESLRRAKDAGADAIKLQTYTADTITLDCNHSDFIVQDGPWHGRRLYDLYREAHTPWEWHAELFDEAKSLGITIFSTPFDPTAVDLLENLNAPAYKIASPEIVDLPLIALVAQTGKPMILSTGMATKDETLAAVDTARQHGCEGLIVLHCTSAYPTELADANLSTIPALAKLTDTVVGLSDHTMGSRAAVAAVALGGSFIEKHFTISRKDGGVDSAFSMEPDELRELVSAVRETHDLLGAVSDAPIAAERSALRNRRSLYVISDVVAGEMFTESNVRSIRPGFGLAPALLPQVLGKRASQPITRGTALELSMIEFGSRLTPALLQSKGGVPSNASGGEC